MFLRSLTEEYLRKVFYMLISKAIKISGYIVNHGKWKHGSGEQCKEFSKESLVTRALSVVDGVTSPG